MDPICLFDGHADTISHIYEHGGGLWERVGHLDLHRTTTTYGCYAQFFAIFGTERTRPGLTLWQLFQEQYNVFRRELEENRGKITFCTTAAGAAEANRAGRAAAFLSVEGAELLDCDIEKLEQARSMGVRAVNLTWNHANLLSGSNAEERDRGLSEQGRAFVRRMHELGVLVDVSHLSDPGFWDVAEMSDCPFFASHSNARAVFSHRRNLTDAQFTAIIEHRGVAGLNLYADFLGEHPDLDTVVAHLEHFLALGGEQNVSLGADWDGCDVLPGGVTDIRDMEKLYERLLQRNYHEALVRGVFYENLMRVVNEVCSM